ncbi:MAG: MoxR family ATPase [Clostridia bacterium]|nr:MoxR family ATPase [Clostridia bacterium]
MTVKEFGECIEFNIEHNIRHAILGLGAPGVGKSQLIRQIGRKYGYKVIDVRLAQMSEVEIAGLIYPNETRTKTIWLSPEILPDEKRDGPKTILLLDEITSCTKRVQVAAYQLILDRRIGQYELPEGCFVIALGNREDDDGVYIRLAGPLADRFEIHYLEADFNDWKNDFAIPHGVNQLVIDYLTLQPSSLHTQAVDGENMVFATPRSWVCVSDILNIDPDVRKPVIRHKIIGNIGRNEGGKFVEFCEKMNFVTPKQFLNGACVPKTPDMCQLLVKGLLNEVSFLKDCQTKGQLMPAQEALIGKVLEAFLRMPAEYTMTGIRGMVDMNRPLVKQIIAETDTSQLTAFIRENEHALGLDNPNKCGTLLNRR